MCKKVYNVPHWVAGGANNVKMMSPDWRISGRGGRMWHHYMATSIGSIDIPQAPAKVAEWATLQCRLQSGFDEPRQHCNLWRGNST